MEYVQLFFIGLPVKLILDITQIQHLSGVKYQANQQNIM